MCRVLPPVVSGLQGASNSSWRLWPFSGWQAGGGSGKPPAAVGGVPPGSSPPGAVRSASDTSAAAGRTASDKPDKAPGSLHPSGGSFNNLLALMGPGSKSAPDRSRYNVSADAGDSPRGPDLRYPSFVSTASSPTRLMR